MRMSTPLLASERRARLRELLAQDGAIRLESAAEVLRVSAMTVRRDLADLEAEGLVRRVRGGAVAPLLPEPFGARATARASAKAIIAKKAIDLVPLDGAAAFDASTTSNALISLVEARDLLIATNSLENAAAARRRPGVHSILVGGELEERTGSFVGPVAVLAARSMSYAAFFTSASAVDAEFGPSEVSLTEAHLKSAFSENAERTVVLADSVKLGRRALARAVEWDAVDLLVTDLDPEDPRLDPFRALVELL